MKAEAVKEYTENEVFDKLKAKEDMKKYSVKELRTMYKAVYGIELHRKNATKYGIIEDLTSALLFKERTHRMKL